ncbi:hypothetical protein ACRS6Y_14850 [Bacillus cytotoxicus]
MHKMEFSFLSYYAISCIPSPKVRKFNKWFLRRFGEISYNVVTV